MAIATARLVTVVAESILRDRLQRLVLEEGATGYTVAPCEGEGSRDLRAAQPIGEQNVRLEAVVGEAVADRILARLAAEIFPRYAAIAWSAPVEVVRGDKFVRG